jgi:hypothetical protein
MRHFNYQGFLIVFIIISFMSCAAGVKKIEKKGAVSIIGRWEGVDRTGRLGAFDFAKNGGVTLIIDGRPLGNSGTNEPGILRYKIDYSKDPIELDIFGIDTAGVERGKILMIVRFITDDSIKIRTYFNETRPVNFENETIDDTIILDRKSD